MKYPTRETADIEHGVTSDHQQIDVALRGEDTPRIGNGVPAARQPVAQVSRLPEGPK